MTTDMQREAFERWAKKTYGISRHQSLPDQYAAAGVECAWQAWQAAQAELTELRAIVARLREPVSDEAVKSAAIAFDKSPIRNNGPMRAALNAYRKRILGETEC